MKSSLVFHQQHCAFTHYYQSMRHSALAKPLSVIMAFKCELGCEGAGYWELSCWWMFVVICRKFPNWHLTFELAGWPSWRSSWAVLKQLLELSDRNNMLLNRNDDNPVSQELLKPSKWDRQTRIFSPRFPSVHYKTFGSFQEKALMTDISLQLAAINTIHSPSPLCDI